MVNKWPLAIFILIELTVVSFIFLSAGGLPSQIASHFNESGQPNDFMTNTGYVVFMIVFALGIPGFVVLPVLFEFDIAFRNINIPNKDYWLAKENKIATIALLKQHILYFGMLISLFIAYVHWLIIKANNSQPVQLPETEFWLGLTTFILSTVFWGLYLVVKFKNLPRT